MSRATPPSRSPPRVLHLVTSDAFAGIERHALNLIREQRAQGWRAELACPPSAHRLRALAEAAGIPVVPADEVHGSAWLILLARNTLRDPPAVLHVNDGRSAIVGALLSSTVDGLFVRTQHFVHTATMDRSGLAKRASLLLHQRLNSRLDGYIAVSQSVAQAARQRNEVGNARMAVIPPAIQLPSNAAVEGARAARAAAPCPTVVFAGRLEFERHLDVLLRAVPLVRAQLPECRFLIAGSGAAEGDLRRLARELTVEDAITWTGWVEDTYGVLASGHAYVNTWAREAFGMAMAEAMASALPVIAVAAGANNELIDDGVTGYLVPEDDPPAMADAIVRQLSDRASASRMGEAARRHAMSVFGSLVTAAATLEFYELLGIRKQP